MCSIGGNQSTQFQNALDSMSRKIVIYQEQKGSKTRWLHHWQITSLVTDFCRLCFTLLEFLFEMQKNLPFIWDKYSHPTFCFHVIESGLLSLCKLL